MSVCVYVCEREGCRERQRQGQRETDGDRKRETKTIETEREIGTKYDGDIDNEMRR